MSLNDNMKKKDTDLEQHRNQPDNTQSYESNDNMKKKETDFELKNSPTFWKHQAISKDKEYTCRGKAERSLFFIVPNFRESCKETLTSEANKLFAVLVE